MGTQQILLIVLSVIIVGVAIAVGITMFTNQAYNANQSAIAGEAQSYAAQVIQWYKTPVSQGGAGQKAALVEADLAPLASYIGFLETGNKLTSENGTFTLTIPTGGTTAEIVGIGKEVKGGKNPKITTTVTLGTGIISSVVGVNP